MIQRYILSFFCVSLVSILGYIPINSVAQYGIREDLTGIWRGQDQSTYYVREFPNTYWDTSQVCTGATKPCIPSHHHGHLKDLGHDIMWVGLSPDNGKSWANVFVGKYYVDKITGTWVDVPRGKTVGSGTLTLEVWKAGELCAYSKCFRPIWDNPYLVMSKIGSTGSSFGTSSWYKPSCPSPEYSLDPDSFHFSEKDCGWDKNLPAKTIERLLPTPPGGPPLQPPPGLGK